MKNLLFIFCLSFLMLFSCSESNDDDVNSDNNSNSSDVVLLKKIVSTDGSSQDFIYVDSSKLSRMNYSNGSYIKYTYTGNLITIMEWFGSDNIINVTSFYNYENNKLKQEQVYSSSGLEVLSDYVYNTDGTITVTNSNYSGGDTVTSVSVVKEYLDVAGNIIKQEQFYNNSLSYTRLYSYDTKNFPLKNTIGLNFVYRTYNNLIKQTTTWANSAQIDTDISQSYEYNSNGYPISSTDVIDGISTRTTYSYW